MSPERKPDDSDSEDDADYAPPADKEDSSDEEPELKRARTTSPPPPIENEAEKKRQRDALWASFQASVESTSQPIQPEQSKPRVKIEKRYRFAGEDVVEVVEVDTSSADAKKWPVWREPGVGGPSSILSASPDVAQSTSVPPEPTVAVDPPAKLPPKRPGPRKPKITLAALPASSSVKAKKLTTLDKSAMDWRSHVQATEDSGLKDELEANRRSGGYLEKVEFLKRVDERKDDVLEANKGSKRRRL